MMLDWLGNKQNDKKCIEVGSKLEESVIGLVKSNIKTKDIGGKKTTKEFTNELIQKLV